MNSSKPVLLPCTRRHRKIDKPKPATTKSQPQETPKPKLQNSEPSALQVPMPLSGAALQPAETAPQPAGERKKRAKNTSPPPDRAAFSHVSWSEMFVRSWTFHTSQTPHVSRCDVNLVGLHASAGRDDAFAVFCPLRPGGVREVKTTERLKHLGRVKIVCPVQFHVEPDA